MSIFGDFMIDEATKLQGKLGDAEAYAHKLRSELTTTQQQRDGLYRALAELVACKALKDRMDAAWPDDGPKMLEGQQAIEYKAMRDEYNARKPLAWHAARTALSAMEKT